VRRVKKKEGSIAANPEAGRKKMHWLFDWEDVNTGTKKGDREWGARQRSGHHRSREFLSLLKGNINSGGRLGGSFDLGEETIENRRGALDGGKKGLRGGLRAGKGSASGMQNGSCQSDRARHTISSYTDEDSEGRKKRAPYDPGIIDGKRRKNVKNKVKPAGEG